MTDTRESNALPARARTYACVCVFVYAYTHMDLQKLKTNSQKIALSQIFVFFPGKLFCGGVVILHVRCCSKFLSSKSPFVRRFTIIRSPQDRPRAHRNNLLAPPMLSRVSPGAPWTCYSE